MTDSLSTIHVQSDVVGSEDATLAKLSKLWRKHHNAGLEIRHLTGLLLNEQFGEPTSRQPYGTGKLANYAEKLGVAEIHVLSAVSRIVA